MVNKALVLIVSVVLIGALVATGCHPARRPVPLTDPVPQRANLVASIEIREILTDEDLSGMPSTCPEDREIPLPLYVAAPAVDGSNSWSVLMLRTAPIIQVNTLRFFRSLWKSPSR